MTTGNPCFLSRVLLFLGRNQELADQAIHFFIGYSTVATAALHWHRPEVGFWIILGFALVKEFLVDTFGPEHDSWRGSLLDFVMYVAGAGVAYLLR